ncbi:hypothetical protein B7463_g7323, partial [Scytalidium lignicola]
MCLVAPNYTVFSNTRSQNHWIKKHGGYPTKDHFVVYHERPCNAIYLAVGGFYQKGVYKANPDDILVANGDIGDNETAGFDPIFFLHHCFIDNVFRTWQKYNNSTIAGDLAIEPGYCETISDDGLPNIPPDTPLDMSSPLDPFERPDGSVYTSFHVTDISNQLGYDYGIGSLDASNT